MSETELLTKLSMLEYKLLASIKLQNLWVPVDAIGPSLAAFVSPIYQFFPEQDIELQALGSCIRIKFGEKFLAVATQHQFREANMEFVGLRSDNERTNVTSAGYIFAKSKENDTRVERHDLCFFDFSEQVSQGLFEAGSFLKIPRFKQIEQGQKIGGGLLYGYVFEDQKWEFDETGERDFRLTHIQTVLREVVCEYQGKGVDFSSAKWVAVGSKDFDPNGMSGGAAFAILDRDSGYEAQLAGIVVRGGNGIFYTINVESILALLSAAFPGK